MVPTQAISALAIAAIGVVAYRGLLRGRRDVFVRAITLYSMFRFVIEFVRDDAVRNHYGLLSTSQWLALIVLVGCIAWRWSWLGASQAHVTACRDRRHAS